MPTKSLYPEKIKKTKGYLFCDCAGRISKASQSTKNCKHKNVGMVLCQAVIKNHEGNEDA